MGCGPSSPSTVISSTDSNHNPNNNKNHNAGEALQAAVANTTTSTPSDRSNPNNNNNNAVSSSIAGSNAGKKFNDHYKLGKQLGSGAFSVVRAGSCRKTGNSAFAVKIVTKSKLTKDDDDALKEEVSILRECAPYPNIIRLFDVFDEREHYYLVTEKMDGGELFDRIVQKSYYNEKEARDTCVILFKAIQYCHSKHIAHRDLKPENLLLQSTGNDSDVKIADFGFAKKCYKAKSLVTQCGTPGYVAPEILEGVPYDTQSDLWSLGVIAYILLGGYPPFIDANQRELFRKIRKGEFEFHVEYWASVSDEAKTFIRQLLTVNPDVRLTADAALQQATGGTSTSTPTNHNHHLGNKAARNNKTTLVTASVWLAGGLDDDVLAGHDLGAALAELKKFNAKRKFKSAVQAVMLTQKMSSLGLDFKKNLD